MIDRETRDMFATAKNPIFEYERRRMRWVKDNRIANPIRAAAVDRFVNRGGSTLAYGHIDCWR